MSVKSKLRRMIEESEERQKKAKKRNRRKTEEAARMAPEICTGCSLPMPAGKSFKHNWCY